MGGSVLLRSQKAGMRGTFRDMVAGVAYDRDLKFVAVVSSSCFQLADRELPRQGSTHDEGPGRCSRYD